MTHTTEESLDAIVNALDYIIDALHSINDTLRNNPDFRDKTIQNES